MPTTTYWITDTPHPASDDIIAAADAAGADAILHGIPPTLADVIPAGTLGVFEVTTPDPPPFPPLHPAGALATLLVVDAVIPLGDAANAVGVPPEHLIHEAEAWGAAS